MVKIKICGITRIQDALACVDEGADALGFIFVRSSPRYIAPAQVRSIISRLPPFVVPVGVFVNAPAREIQETIDASGIRVAQLQGEERPEDFGSMTIPAYKGFRVGKDFDPSLLRKYPGTLYLLDTFSEGSHGGTGKTFDWDVAVQAKEFGRVMVSGGLTPENAGHAIEKIRPYAVDVSSGVESAPGIKDSELVRAFIGVCRRAE